MGRITLIVSGSCQMIYQVIQLILHYWNLLFTFWKTEERMDVDVRARKQSWLTDFWKTEEMEDGATYVRIRPKDRLSELPDALLIRILSLLDIIEAVKTGILSKRWKLLWTQVDSIVYRGWYHRGTEEECNRIYQQYVSFVDHTLMQCTSSSIKKFRLKKRSSEFPEDNAMYELFNKWLNFIMQKNVECIKLNLNDCDYSVPNCLYRNPSLVNLKIMGVTVSVSSPVSWPSLRSLNFHGAIDDDSLANILLGCPVLETIVLDTCSGMKNIEIMSPSVKKLKLAYPYDDIIKVNAPWLQELELKDDDVFIRQFQLVDVSSLKRASLWFNYENWRRANCTYPNGQEWNEMVEGLFKSLCHVAELTVSTEFIQALAVSKLLGKPYPVLRCKHMTVLVPIWKYDLYGVACLLQNAPYLETLFITVAKWQDHYMMPYPKENFDRREEEMSLPEGKFMHLKYIKIVYERDCNHCPVNEEPNECLDVELLEYILRITPGLKKLVIMSTGGYWGHQRCYTCNTICASQHAALLSSKLLLILNKTWEWELVKTKSAFEFRFSNWKPLLIKD